MRGAQNEQIKQGVVEPPRVSTPAYEANPIGDPQFRRSREQLTSPRPVSHQNQMGLDRAAPNLQGVGYPSERGQEQVVPLDGLQASHATDYERPLWNVQHFCETVRSRSRTEALVVYAVWQHHELVPRNPEHVGQVASHGPAHSDDPIAVAHCDSGQAAGNPGIVMGPPVLRVDHARYAGQAGSKGGLVPHAAMNVNHIGTPCPNEPR